MQISVDQSFAPLLGALFRPKPPLSVNWGRISVNWGRISVKWGRISVRDFLLV